VRRRRRGVEERSEGERIIVRARIVGLVILVAVVTATLSNGGKERFFGLGSAKAGLTGAGVTYVGAVPGTNAFVGIAVRPSGVLAYVCDSKNVAAWLSGSPGSTLSGHGYRLTETVDGSNAKGTVYFPDGSTHAFVASRASRPAGLWRGVETQAGVRYVGGWIVLPDGSQRGAVSADGTTVDTPTLDPANPDVKIKKKPKKPLIVIIAILIG
jgi:hypothetical protein